MGRSPHRSAVRPASGPSSNIFGTERGHIPIAPKSLPGGMAREVLNIDACGVHVQAVVRRRIAEVLRWISRPSAVFPRRQRETLTGLAVPAAMFVYSLVFEFPEMMAVATYAPNALLL